MKKQLLILGIIILLVTVGLSGCNGNGDAEKFVGTWYGQEYHKTYIFYTPEASSGRVQWGESGMADYRIEDGKLYIHIDGYMVTGIYSYSFSNNDKTITFTDINMFPGQITHFEKQ